MKKVILSLVAILLLFGSMSCAQVTMLSDVSELPRTAQNFLSQNFADEKISYIKKDSDVLEKKRYEVKFTSGFEVDFDKNGQWLEVDCKRTKVPNAIILPAILTYVNQHFANTFIVQIEKEIWGFSVQLNNDIDLDFNKEGAFKRIDE